MIRVAVICSTLNQLGGPAVHIRNLYGQLQGHGICFKLIFCSSDEKELRNFMLAGGIPNEDMIFIPHRKKKFLFPFIIELIRIFRRESFDIVHAFETQTQVLAGWAARWAGVDKFICHCEAQFLPSTISFPKRFLFRLLNFFLKGYFSKTIVISGGLKNELIRHSFRPRNKIEIVPLGIQIPFAADRRFFYSGFDAGEPVIGAVSRLSIEKGLDRLLKAAVLVLKELPSARFVICGKGDDASRLKNLALQLNIADKVEFNPWMDNVIAVMESFDIYAMPSHREGLGITLLEAMSVGRPVVASDIDGIRDIVENGVDGFLVDTFNSKAFAQAILGLCRKPENAAMVGRRAAQKVREYFNVEREAARIKEIYEALIY